MSNTILVGTVSGGSNASGSIQVLDSGALVLGSSGSPVTSITATSSGDATSLAIYATTISAGSANGAHGVSLLSSNVTLSITAGTISGGSASGAYGYNGGTYSIGSGTISVSTHIIGGSASGAHGAVSVIGSANPTISGSVIGGAAGAYGLSQLSQSCTISTTIGVSGGSGGATAYGVYIASGATVTIDGNVSANATSGAPGVYNASGGTLNVNNFNSTTPAILVPSGAYSASSGCAILNAGTAAECQLTGVTMTIGNNAGTGTLAAPAVQGPFTLNSSPLNGVSIASTTYYFNSYPSNQYSDPGVANVKTGTTYSYQGSNNKTGTYLQPPRITRSPT